jgi:hypothetical protein
MTGQISPHVEMTGQISPHVEMTGQDFSAQRNDRARFLGTKK